MKVFIIIICEVLAVGLLFVGGLAIDALVLFPKAEAGAQGHPVPVFTIMLPIFGAFVMIAADVIIAIVCIIKAVLKKTKK